MTSNEMASNPVKPNSWALAVGALGLTTALALSGSTAPVTANEAVSHSPKVETKPEQAAKVLRSDCNKDGCTVVLKVQPHTTVDWTSSKTYSGPENFLDVVHVNGEPMVAAEVVHPKDCTSVHYGNKVVASLALCEGEDSPMEFHVASIANNPLIVRLKSTHFEGDQRIADIQ